MPLPLYLVDAFTDQAFKGNPAGVCILEKPACECWMQKLAMEMNQAETAFIVPEDGHFGLRWFTPTTEVPLCGHATLASAYALWAAGRADSGSPIVFETKGGRLTCMKAGDLIEMDFPAERSVHSQAAPEHIAKMAPGDKISENAIAHIVELENENEVLDFEPHLNAILNSGVRAVIITARSQEPGIDFKSRFFAPALGVPEDSVTGSAHCALGPYWSAKLGKDEVTGYQASPRGGIVHIRIKGDRVVLGGSAQMVLRGELCVDSE